MRSLIFGLVLLFPYIGLGQNALSHLSCNITTGKMVWNMGSEVRTYIWVKQGRTIQYFKIDNVPVLELKQIINQLIKKNEKDIFAKSCCKMAGK